MNLLIDTCVLSELVKPQAHNAVVEWLDAQEEERLFLSVLTLGELEKGIAKLPGSPRRQRLNAWVRADLPARFLGRVLPIDAGTSQRWGTLTGEAEARGVSLPVVDSLLAATCMQNQLVMVSRNVEDFERCGVACINPWVSGASNG